MGKRLLKTPKHPFGVPDAVFLYLLGMLLFVLALAAILPPLLGFTPYAVTSASMAPTLSRGDLVFVSPVALDKVEVGAIVTYHTEGGVLTHRVYSVDFAAGTLRTKADSSVYLDTLPVTAEMLLGRVVYKLPLVGYLSFLGREKGGAA